MINISQKCLQALKEDAVQHAEIKARLINGKTLTLTDADLILNGLEVENHAVCGEQLEVGSMTAAVLKLTLNNEDGRFNDIFFAGAELTVNLLIPLGDGTSYTIPYGVYTVDEQPRTWSTIEIEAYDNMVKLDIPFDAVGLSGISTLSALVGRGLRTAGVNSDGSDKVFPAFSYRGGLDVTKIKSENPITWRQVLMWCCQCAGVCGFADGNGYIHFGFYKKYTPGILQTESAENLETEKADVLFIDGAAEGDFPLPPSLRFIDNMHLDESDCILTGHQFKVGELLYPADAVMDYGILTENNLVFAALNPQSRTFFAQSVNRLLTGFTYRPYACKILSMPQLQLLDGVDYDENGQHHHSIVTNYTFRLNGFMNIEAKAKSQVQKGWASLGALTPGQQAIIDSVSQKVDTTRDQLSSYENALLLFNEKMLRSMGLYKTAVNDPNGGIITYFHNMETLENSDTIYMFGASGFAWTTEGWKEGNPVWHYGFTDTGDAILNTIHAYKLSAELIETGYLRSQNGASWINMDDGTFCFRSATPEGLDLDTGEAVYSYEKVLELANKQLNVYGTLRNLQYPSYSVSVGPSERNDGGAFTVTDSTNGWGNLFQVYGVSNSTEKGTIWTAPFLLNSAKTNRKGIAVFPHDISIFNDNYDKQTHVKCDEGSVDLAGANAFIKLYRDQINISTNPDKHSDCWFNFYKPERGKTPTAYKFGNGTDGGHADVVAGGYLMGYGKGNSKSFAFLNQNNETCIRCADINCSGQIVGKNTFVDYLRSYGNITANGNISADGKIISTGEITAENGIYVFGKLGIEGYYTNYKLSVVGNAKAQSWDVVSDPDLKENVVSQDSLKALDKVSALKFYSYDIKKEVYETPNAHTDIGIMADEAPTEIQSSDGTGIDLYAYISLTAKALQELSEKVEQQAQEIVQLKAEIEKLKQ